MIITHFEAVMGALAAVVTVLIMLASMLRWFFRQGAAQQKLISSVDANTEATGKLTASYEKSSAKTEAMLLDHEKRIIRLEDRPAPRY